MSGHDDVLSQLLRGERPSGLRYAELARVLQERCQYTLVGFEGPYRSWKHDCSPRLLTVRDEGSQPMYSRYIDAAGRHVKAVRDAGGFRETDDAR